MGGQTLALSAEHYYQHKEMFPAVKSTEIHHRDFWHVLSKKRALSLYVILSIGIAAQKG